MSTPYQIFSAEIPKILAGSPNAHYEIAEELQQKYPGYCDDSIKCPHLKNNSIQPEWDHIARNVEQALQRKKIIKYNRDLGKWAVYLPI